MLADQDRTLWDEAQIGAGRAALDLALALRGHGPYVLQAAIAALHTEEPRDWLQIAALYGQLGRLTHSPIVELNRAIAVAEHAGPAAGLELVERSRLRTSSTCTPRVRSCCAGSAAPPRPVTLTAVRSSSSTTTPSADCSSAGSRNSPAD